MIRISRSVRLSSTAVFLYIIFAISENLVMANSINTKAVKFIDGAITIDADNLIELYRSMPDVALIDSRLSEDRVHGYIEMSRSLPLADTDCLSLAGLISDKDQPIVFYDNGLHSNDSMTATSIAVRCGYSQLFWFGGGFSEWEDRDYPFVIK